MESAGEEIVNEKLVDIECQILHETEKAFLVLTDRGKAWLPKSQVEIEDGVATLPEWLAQDKELI